MSFTEGENIGPYRIIGQLGQGGMARVYKAYHAGLDRYVALKVLQTNLTEEPGFSARFQREARLVAKLDHPNIVPIHDYAEHEKHPYLVMKYIEGETLKARLERGPLTSEEINRVVDSVGSALTYAHGQGVLHRDIKPSNVLIAKDGHVYLADFGLARIAQSNDATFTASDMIIGTPQYISPEQALGEKNLDERTDIYSFGIMLYEMVVGRVPFSADTPFSMIYDHIYSPLPLPRSINPSVPESVERALLKALAKERTDRYQTVSDMVEAFKCAWKAAGVPMQGTAVILPGQRGPAPSPEKSRRVVTGMAKAKKRASWPFVLAGVVGVLCCSAVVFASLGGALSRFWPASATPTQIVPVTSTTLTDTPVTATDSLCSGEQTWFNREFFPEQEIRQCWDQDHYITDLTYADGYWRGVMTKEVDYTDQVYFTDSSFPEAKIGEYWNQGFEITGAYYGNRMWIVVMSKGTGFTNQIYFTDTDFPETDIHGSWNKGYWITSTGYGNGQWIVVMSQGPQFTYQNYVTDVTFPEDRIRTYWDDDYYITNVTYGSSTYADSVWVIVLSSGGPYTNQYYYDNNTFPEDGINEDWADDFFITNLTFGDSLWVVVMSKR